MNDKQIEAFARLHQACVDFAAAYLNDLPDELVTEIEAAITDRDGEMVTQVISSYRKPARIIVSYSQSVGDERRLVPLVAAEEHVAERVQ